MINTGDAGLIVDVLQEAVDEGWPEPRIGVEVGVYRGETSAKLLQEFPDLELVMVDRWCVPDGLKDGPWVDSGDSCAKLKPAEHIDNYLAAQMATDFARARRIVMKMPSVDAASTIETVITDIDFAFIDDDHSYEGVTRSLQAWLPFVRSGGILAGHDYGHPRNARGLFGVDKAVSEMLLEVDTELYTKGSVWWIVKP